MGDPRGEDKVLGWGVRGCVPNGARKHLLKAGGWNEDKGK